MIIVFLGPPGSGKGTQAQMLRLQHGFFHFDTGSLLRAEAASGSPLGQRIAGFINQGNLVPLDIIADLLDKFLSTTQAQRIMFDGFPRSLEQARLLTDLLVRNKLALAKAIYLEIDPSELLERIANRRCCKFCGSIYNVATNPPTGPCPAGQPACELIQRPDDSEQVFGQRLRVYLSETLPVLDYFLEINLLERIDGSRNIDEVSNNIVQLLSLQQ